MFQPAADVVKAGLVQLPCICVGPKRTRAGPAAAPDEVGAVVVVVDPPACVVVVDPPAAIVVVALEPCEPLVPADVVVVAEPEDAGI